MFVLTLILGLIGLLALYFRKKHNYFKNVGIPYAPGYFPFGSSLVWKCFSGQESLLQVADTYFDQFPNTKLFGFYKPLGEPMIAIKDLDLAKKIMITDFEYFVDRNFIKPNPKGNLHASMMLAALKGDAWKTSRNLVTPMFTSSKLKAIMPLIHQCGESFTKYLGNFEQDHLDCKEAMQRFTIEILGSLGCGVTPNVINETNEFYDQAMLLSGSTAPPLKAALRFAVSFFFPDLSYRLNLSLFDTDNLNFFIEVIKNSMHSRKQRRNDFIDLLRDTVEELDDEKKKKINSENDITDYVIANGLMLFFVGNDTSSGALALALHYMARYPDVQEKLYLEIQDAIDNNNGESDLDYHTLNNLPYLGKVIRETIRLWGINFFDRTCVKDYFIPELNYTIPKGMHVTIAGGKIMRDAGNYENPLEFDPENHFTTNSPSPSNFLGFGQGPRNCIGMRLAYTIVRSGLIHTLAKYKIVKGPKTTEDWKFNAFIPGGIGHNQLFVKLEPRF